MNAHPVQTRFFQAIQNSLTSIYPRGSMPGWHAPAVTGEGALESAYAVTDLAAAAIGAEAMALAAYIAACTGRAPAVSVDRRLSSLWFGRSLRPIGWRVPPLRDPVTREPTGSGRESCEERVGTCVR